MKTYIYDMMTDDHIDPVGIDSENPVFSWKIFSEKQNYKQASYRIKVRNEKDEIVWDTNEVISDKTFNIKYGGSALCESTEYKWDLELKDNYGDTVSSSATFETGLSKRDPFNGAKWIGYADTLSPKITEYTIDYDFVILENAAGFCFSMSSDSSYVMWQINIKKNEGKVLLRPHFRRRGEWIKYPGFRKLSIDEYDIADFTGYGADVKGKKISSRIEVSEKTVRTYFGKDRSSLSLASVFENDSEIPLCKVGFREAHGESALFGNIKVSDSSGIIYESADDISSDFKPESETVDKMFKAGNGDFEIVYTRSDLTENLPAYRKSIFVEEGLESAKLYVSSLGVHETYINGERIGRKYPDGRIEYHELKPASNEMLKRKVYNSYDITWMLEKGENIVSSIVTSGWWSGRIAACVGDNTAYIAKILLKYKDGRKVFVNTDESWKTSPVSPVLFADIYDGESYDARTDFSFMKKGFDDSSWDNAYINNEFNGIIEAWRGSYIVNRKDRERSAEKVLVYKGSHDGNETRLGKINVLREYSSPDYYLDKGETLLVDFGQNFSGWEYFTVEGERGTHLVIEHGEMLNDNCGEKERGNDGPGGSLYNLNYRTAKATTKYILSGNGKESYHPSFTYYGFRYIEIRTDKPVVFSNIKGEVITSVEKDTGFIETSDKKINKLISNIRWGQYSNYLSVPTDCPQRDERLGWSADTQVFTEAGCFLGFSKSFLGKYTLDLRDAQADDGSYPGVAPTGRYKGARYGGTGWSDAGVIIPYTLYKMYGYKDIISENYPNMKFYLDNFLANSNKKGPNVVWGDWLAYESNDTEIQEIIGVAYYAWDAMLMAKMARILGYEEDALKYDEVYRIEKDFFIEQYVNEDGTVKRPEQSICLHALYLDLLPDEKSVNAVINQLISNIERNGNKLQTGFLGTKIILDTLTKIGRNDIAYSLLLQENNPSWLYSVLQGATTIWERWNSYTIDKGFGDVGMNSFNHYAYGSIAAWMFRNMAGISYDESNPGFARIICEPHPDKRIEKVVSSYESVSGKIETVSEFVNGKWNYSITVPANTVAEITLSGKDGKKEVLKVGSGKYTFER